ncbi:MAG TPA: tyrosine decarboxylase MfnA [Thermoplasmata archaeon]|jgi:tyrosine decarboxylase / aspartate 1-decarboxylase|nr:MAG TPA: tyrosine decarboxylase MfnA [Thermoplasmata archaeon]
MISLDSQKRQKIFDELERLHQRDFCFSSGHILGSMCTVPHPIAQKAYLQFLETNLGDPALCPGTKEIESRFIGFISKLLHAPKTSVGQIVSGGTEGNITAMWIAKQLSGKKEIILPQSAHFSFQKIASLMDMKLIEIPLKKEYVMDVAQLKKKISKRTAAVVGLAGSTELGTIDPIPQLSEICNDEHVFFHVDAAFGGFVIPFLKELHYTVPDFDFKLKGVTTISIDSHKMGYAAIPLGTLMIRKKQWLESISVESPYISIEKQAGILGTRSGAPVAAAYAVARYLGYKGYRNMVQSCMEVTQYAEQRITELGLALVMKPTMNVIGVKLKKPELVVKKLSEQGWQLNKVKRLSCIRLVLMPHITKQIIDEFIPVLQKTCEEVGEI